MSLIHDALKKVEGGRQAPAAQAVGKTAAATKAKLPDRRAVLAGALIAVLFAAGTAAYIVYRARAPVAVTPLPAHPAQRPEAAQAPADEPADGTAALNRKGVELYRAGRYQDAIVEFKAAVEMRPGDAVLRNNHGLASMSLGRTAEAGQSFKKALELSPAYPEALNNYGALRGLRGDRAGAVKLYEKALSIRPDYMDARLNLAVALESLGRRAEALAHYRKYAEMNRGGQPPAGLDKKIFELGARASADKKGPLAKDR